MILKLSEDEILKVCKDCKFFDGDSCRSIPPKKPLSQIRRCKKWDTYYGERCVRA